MAARLAGLLVILPVTIAVTTHVALRWGIAAYGQKLGYLAGFVFPYWLLWCYAFPARALGARSLQQLLQAPRGGALPWLAAVTPAAILLLLGWKLIVQQDWRVLAASAAIGAVNGLGEELLWRGVFLRCFPRAQRWAGWVFTGVCFSLWHLAFLSVEPAAGPGGNVGFLLGAVAIGLLWGWVAQRTGSLRAPAVGHVALNFCSLIGARYFA